MSHQKYSLPAIQARINSPPPALITNNRISVPLQGRLYPFVTPQTELPDVFREMPQKLFDRMEFTAIRDKSTAFKKFATAVAMLDRWRQDFDALAQRIATASGFPTPHRMGFKNAPAATAELAALPVEQIVTAMATVLKHSVVRFLIELVYTLDEMVKSQHVGIIDWTCADACRYHYFEFKDETTVTGTRSQSDHRAAGRVHTVTTNTQRDKERVVSLTRHVHDLIDAKRQTKWRHLMGRFPVRAHNVAEHVPSWLDAEYVEGQQIRDLRIERELSRQQWTESETTVHTWEESPPVIQETPQYRFDPAIIIGHYVLVGWNEDEKQQDEIKAQQEAVRLSKQCNLCNGTGRIGGTGKDGPARTCFVCEGAGKL
jgi:hypothetical protein